MHHDLQQAEKILAFPYSRYDSIICDGAVRSGKTSMPIAIFQGIYKVAKIF